MKVRTFAVALAAGYVLWVRPRLLRWGASEDEVRRHYPGADLIPDGRRSATMAVTIDAPRAEVWPWLVQMGADRAGWYSWDRLDNWGHPSATRINSEWQQITLGDRLAGTPDGSQSWEVAALEPERFLRPRWLQPIAGLVVLEPTHWIMQTRQFANLTRRIERRDRPGDLPGVSP